MVATNNGNKWLNIIFALATVGYGFAFTHGYYPGAATPLNDNHFAKRIRVRLDNVKRF